MIFRTILQSSMVLQDVLGETHDNHNTRALIARQLWRQYQSPDTAMPNCTIDKYDEILDLALVKLGIPSAFHSCVWNKTLDISHLIDAKANPHLVSGSGDRIRFTDFKAFDTPTSFAMYNSDNFFCWREAVCRAKLDLDDFITMELEPGCDTNGREMPLLLANWTKDVLRKLFDSTFLPSECERICPCLKKDRVHIIGGGEPILKQPKWLRFLWQIKRNRDPSIAFRK